MVLRCHCLTEIGSAQSFRALATGMQKLRAFSRIWREPRGAKFALEHQICFPALRKQA